MERRTFLRGILALVALKPVAAALRRSRPTPVLNHDPEFVRFKGVRVDSFTLSIPKDGMIEARVEGLAEIGDYGSLAQRLRSVQPTGRIHGHVFYIAKPPEQMGKTMVNLLTTRAPSRFESVGLRC